MSDEVLATVLAEDIDESSCAETTAANKPELTFTDVEFVDHRRDSFRRGSEVSDSSW